MRKTTIINTIIAIMYAIFATFAGTNVRAVASTAETTDYVTIAMNNGGRLFLLGTDMSEQDFSISTLVENLRTSSTNQKIDFSTEDLEYFQEMFSNRENQWLSVEEDIITKEVKVVMHHPRGCGTFRFDHCYSKEEVINPVAEFNYKGFRYTVFVKSMDEEPCIAKMWDPIPYSRVYDLTEELNEYEWIAVKKLLNEAFTNGSEIEFIEDIDGKVHAFVDYDWHTNEFIFEGYNQEPLGEILPELIVTGIETAQDQYSILIEDGKIRVESAKRSGFLDYPIGWNS